MITIIVDNYKGQRFNYTMPDIATIEMVSENRLSENGKLIKTNLNIDIYCPTGINLERKEIE